MRKLILALMLSVLLLGFGTAMAATSAVDNLPGGAGITYWQAGGTWETLVNIQSIDAGCSSIAHVAIYDRDSVHLIDFNMKLTMLDNVGIIIRQGAAVGQIDLFDYSDGAYGGTAALFDIAVGPPVTVLAPADAGTGIMRGYLTITLNSQDCVAPIGDPELGPTWGPIQGVFAIAPDVLIVRSAIINPIQAFASNAAMIQGFANIAAPGTFEAFDFCDTTPGGNPFAACDFNKDGDLADVFAGLDDANGANVDFTELFLTDNAISHATPCIMCDLAGLFNINYPALGAANGIYWGRFNESVSAGTNTTLVTISPNSTSGLHGATTPGWPRNLTVISYNDAEVGLSYGPVAIPEVAGIGFGLGGITVGSATAGEARISIAAPIMGFTVTETAAFADIYPLVKEVLAISSINQGMPDVPFDQIFLP